MRVLVIEDDAETADFIVRGLEESGHVVSHASTGCAGLRLASDPDCDAMVIDRMLPELDGLSIVRMIRAAELRTPALILTAVAGIDDRVEGLDAGADDYLTKPFALAELLARLNALVRRAPAKEQALLRVADLELQLISREASRGGRQMQLSPREFRLLEYMMRHAGSVLSRSMLLENVWAYHLETSTKLVETQVSRLRAKIDREGDAQLIHTVRGGGYVIRAPS